MNRLLALLLLVVLVLAACGSDSSDDGVGSDDPSSSDDAAVDAAGGGDAADRGTSLSLAGTWTLTDVTVGSATLLLPPSELTITIADGMIQGDAGCNTFSGAIDRGDDGSLTLGPLIQTEMACEYLAFEVEYAAALARVDQWEATPDELAFVADGVRITYQPAAE